MIYEAIDSWNSPYLEHHGIKGMKWGVRHNPIYDAIKNHRRKRITKVADFAKRQSVYAYNQSKALSKSKIGDYDDPDYYELVSKAEQRNAITRAGKLAKEELENSKYWNAAYYDILKSGSIRDAKTKLKMYKKNSYSYAPFI